VIVTEFDEILRQYEFEAARLAAAGQPLTEEAMRDAPIVLADGQREGSRPRRPRRSRLTPAQQVTTELLATGESTTADRYVRQACPGHGTLIISAGVERQIGCAEAFHGDPDERPWPGTETGE
jgi:hypothetical protein